MASLDQAIPDNSELSYKADGSAYEFHLKQVPLAQYPLVKKFYKAARYSPKISKEDSLYCLKIQHKIIAAVRIIHHSDHLMLRSMVVHPQHRKLGIGLQCLKQVSQQHLTSPIWCYPFKYLERFYTLAGFNTVLATNSPVSINEKYRRYSAQGRDILIMCRP